MSGTRPTFASRLRDLALALLNATLMLAVLLVFGAWLLLGRVQDFAAETVGAVAETVGSDLRARLDMQAGRVAEALDRVTTLDDRLVETAEHLRSAPGTADQAVAAELAGLRADLRRLNESFAAAETGSNTVGAASTASPDPMRTQARLTALETRITATLDETSTRALTLDSDLAAEVAALRTDLQDLTAALRVMQDGLVALRQETSGTMRGALRQLFLDLADRVAPPPQNTES